MRIKRSWRPLAAGLFASVIAMGPLAAALPAPESVDRAAGVGIGGAVDVGSDLPTWFEENRVQGLTRFIPFSRSPSGSYWYDTPEYFDHVAEGMRDLGAGAFTRHFKSRDEDPWWPSSVPTGPGGDPVFDGDRWNTITCGSCEGGEDSLFVPAGTDLARDFVDEANDAGLKTIAYYSPEFDGRVAQEHPEWACRLADGTPNNTDYAGNFGTVLDITTPYREIVLQRLLELAERGVAGFYFDRFRNPPSGCWTDQAIQEFEAATGSEAPTRVNYGDETYRKWLDFRDTQQQETVSYWRSEVRAKYPEVVFIVSVTNMPAITSPYSSRTSWARTVDSVKSEYHHAVRAGGRHSVFNQNPDLARPDDDIANALGWTVMRDSANGRPPHVWGFNLGNREHALAYVSSLMTYGAIANIDVWENNLFVQSDDKRTSRDALKAAFDLGSKVSPYLAGTRPLRWAAVHYSESARDQRGGDFRAAWEDVLWPLTGGFGVFVEEGVPVNTINDHQLSRGQLDGYELLYLPNPDELTSAQEEAVEQFEEEGGVVVANDPAWGWSDPATTDDAADLFRRAIQPHLSDSPVRVVGGPEKLHAGVFSLPDQGAAVSNRRLVVAVANDFSFVEHYRPNVPPAGEVAVAPPSASGVEVHFDRDVVFPGGPGSASRPVRAFDAVSGDELVVRPTRDGYKVRLPEFPHMAMLVVDFRPRDSGS